MMSRTFNQLFLFAVFGGFAINYLILLVHAQDVDQSGFISIDCGLAEPSSYHETSTGITYVSDTNFIDTGEMNLVLMNEYKNNYDRPYGSLRSFPEGVRNCYKINVTSGTNYLIRASFFYGNYDHKNKSPKFELYLGPNLWDLVIIKDVSIKLNKELIHVPLRSYIHVCLVNIGEGVPFLSTIELRPLTSASYQTQRGESLSLVSRYDTGLIANKYHGYRYPNDIHDRFWYYYSNHQDDWTQVNTSFIINSNKYDNYQPPSIVMSTAATPKDPTDSLVLTLGPPEGANIDSECYSYLHFAEVEKLQPSQSRLLYSTIESTGEGDTYGPFRLPYLYTSTVYSVKPWSCTAGQYVKISISAADNSTLPPILNAFEIYMAKEFLESETNQQDVDAIIKVKSSYNIEKNWQGDPCAPKNYSWEGVKCSYHDNEEPPRIISLDLSSSGLTGEVAPSIFDLKMIQTLDLSNNNLTGPIPDFLSQFQNLTVLNLEKNKFTGSVPEGFKAIGKNGLLKLSLCDNPNLSGNVFCKKKHNFLIPIVGSIVGISVFLLSVASIWWGLNRKRQHEHAKAAIGSKLTKRQFTYSEILKITNNLEKTLGKGGFGTVYHGRIDKIEVAVKMLSPSSVQGFQQFHAEVDLLTRVHHINLTSLVGYCNDKTQKGLVYEYMAEGNLHEYLSSDSSSKVLNWKGRLEIAKDAAQGLEYLHNGCKPPIIHRDVKSTNILLNENFQAKLSDFGLSRNFPTDDRTHISTCVAGTPGYLDPEYNKSNRLNEKSDVYSFGIVLLEIITSRPVFSKTRERVHISVWVGSMLQKGDIYSIVDPKLERSFNVNSAWGAVELAMACVSTNAAERPTMSEVVVELKECLAKELARTKNRHETENSLVMSENSIAMERPLVR